jgi:hypothetical protein
MKLESTSGRVVLTGQPVPGCLPWPVDVLNARPIPIGLRGALGRHFETDALVHRVLRGCD